MNVQSDNIGASAFAHVSSGFVANNPAYRELLDLVVRVAKIDSTVLVTGESGTGKERISRLLHTESERASCPFVAVNCGAIAESVLESELFGHAKGSFTGANHDRAGFFEAADTGTLLLDEIGELSPGMQVKLLRVLQEREVRRVGENKARPVNVRIVAATNRNLATEVAAGNFRQDLYYRLNVVEIHVPSLCERREDIVPLAQMLLQEQAVKMKRAVSGISPEAQAKLLEHSWPGNVRELENAMERAVALCRGETVEVENLPTNIVSGVEAGAPSSQRSMGIPVRPLDVVEKECILAALEINGGNQARTASELRIGSATLYRKLKSYGMIRGRTPRPVALAAH